MTLLTGFLGAGKSTLINRIMKEHPGVRFGLIVNEFGDVKLESQIVEARDGDVVELSNGCMCCVVRTDLITTVKAFLDSSPEVEHLLVEASGLSDPLPIAQTFAADNLDGRIRFDSILSVVDVVNFARNMENFQVMVNQLKYADFIILTKDDLVTAKETDQVKKLVSALNPKAVMFSHQEKKLFSLVLDTKDLDHGFLEDTKALSAVSLVKGKAAAPRSGAKGSLKQVHKVRHDKVETLFYTAQRPLDFTKIGKILDDLPPQVVRAKGFLYMNTPESAQMKIIFQSVARRNSLDVKPWNPEEPRQSALVFIGQGWDTSELKQRLDAALV